MGVLMPLGPLPRVPGIPEEPSLVLMKGVEMPFTEEAWTGGVVPFNPGLVDRWGGTMSVPILSC